MLLRHVIWKEISGTYGKEKPILTFPPDSNLSLLKITGDLAVEQFTMQSQGDSKSQYLTCGVLTFTLTCASKSQYLTCGVLGFTGTCESIGVILLK